MAQLNEVDLPPNLSCLKSIDTLLRCPICFDFLNITMMTKCSHNCTYKFTVQFITISHVLCLTCHNCFSDTKSLLLFFVLFQQFVLCAYGSFSPISCCVLFVTWQNLCHSNLESPPISPETPAMMIKGKAARQKGLKREAKTLSHFFQKKTPVTSSLRTQTSLEVHMPVKLERVEVCIQQLDNIKQENVDDTRGMVKDEKMDVTAFPSTSQNKLLVKVECPVCGVGVSEQHINKHLDMCLSRDDKKEGLRSGGRRKGMPKLLYTLISVPKLKKMLKECHLSAQGSREQLVRRHQEFTQIYNAQCDALNPKSAGEIAKEVENNERLKNQLENKRKPLIVTTKNQTAEEIEELHSKYRKQHSSEFSRLIAQVRGRLETSKRAPSKQEEKSTEETDSKGAPSSIQNTPQPLISTMLKVKSEEMEGVIELPTRSSSPTITEVSDSSSISDIFC
uniref:RING-type E3 ubiquitin transferase n=1 Tax=Cyprinus carpio TaxID=7962 RepID=A0A8C1UY19_CYPCA